MGVDRILEAARAPGLHRMGRSSTGLLPENEGDYTTAVARSGNPAGAQMEGRKEFVMMPTLGGWIRVAARGDDEQQIADGQISCRHSVQGWRGCWMGVRACVLVCMCVSEYVGESGCCLGLAPSAMHPQHTKMSLGALSLQQACRLAVSSCEKKRACLDPAEFDPGSQ